MARFIEIPLEDLRACGLGFKAKVIHQAAPHIVEYGLEEKIRRVAPEEQVLLLQSIKGIGRWSARVALCDLFEQWNSYLFEDLALRMWARKFWPEMLWPTEEQAFSEMWRQMHGEYVGLVTFYLLFCAVTSQQSAIYKESFS